MSGGNGNRRPALPPASQLSEDTLKRMLDVQASKIGLELKQADIALRELDHNQRLADKSIEAQAADRNDERRSEEKMHLHRLAFGVIIVALVGAMALVSLWLNKDAFVLDLVKVVLGFVGGWGASVAFRRKSAGRGEE